LDAFISYSSSDRALATRLDRALSAAGISVWHDVSDIRLGVLLGDELRTAILDCRTFVLLWSEHAEKSRWVNSEWLMALHQGRFIVACTLDDTRLPQCLESSVFLPVHRVTDHVVRSLVTAIQNADDDGTPLAPVIRSQSPELMSSIVGLADGQQMMTDALASDLDRAAQIQAALDPAMAAARAAWPLDPMIVTLDGFHLKNAYMLEHWGAIQAGRAPEDPVLDQAERRFFETLAIDPTDPSGLNGLGSILFFKRDLNAAEFFQCAAIDQAKQRGQDYPAAQHDLEMVWRIKKEQQAVVSIPHPVATSSSENG
jgi:TIR domain